MINLERYIKTFSDTYFYRVNPLYEEAIFKYLMSAKIIDKTSENFEDALYQVKRRAVSSAYVDALQSDNVVLMYGNIYKPFTVLTAKDLRKRATNELAMQHKIQDMINESKSNKNVDPQDTTSPPTKPKDPNSKVINEKPVKENNLVYDMNFVPFSKPPVVFTEDVLVNAPLKVFINIQSCMNEDGKLSNPEYLVAYLTTAIVNLMYYKMPQKLFSSTSANSEAADCFCKLLTYVVDFMAKISVMGNTKNKCQYLAYKYFYNNIATTFDKNHEPLEGFTPSVRSRAIRNTEISDREAQILDNLVEDKDCIDIKAFIEALSECLKLPNLNLDNFTEKWMYLLGGPQTAFGLEYFPNFSTIITDAYTGVYLNNQKTIEKICGTSMIGYAKNVLNGI